MTFIALIPARAGSQRIKNKNLRKIKSKPLIYYTIKQSLKSKFIKETIVLTDSKKIKFFSIKYGASVPFLRPKKISLHSSLMLETIQYAVKKMNLEENKKYKYVVLLPVTSPLRKTSDIDNCCKKILKYQKADCLVTTYKIAENQNPSKIMFERDSGYLQKEKYSGGKKYFMRNGPAVLITKISKIKKYLLGGKILNYVMPEKRSLDINFIEDFNKAKKLMK